MNQVFLQGGYGNKLFQIAAAFGHAKKMGTPFCITGDKFLENSYLKIIIHYEKESLPRFTEKNFYYSPIDVNGVTLFGYFQSMKYWEHCKDEIKRLFEPCNELKKLIPKFTGETCAVHVRRTDYLTLSDFHFNLGMDYYEAAMNRIGKKKFIIFSDDLEWCKQQRILKNCTFYKGGDGTRTWKDLKDFYTMASCKSHIIANSSFSWWSSFLSGSKEVIAPKNWFGEKKKHYDTTDLYRPEMIVI